MTSLQSISDQKNVLNPEFSEEVEYEVTDRTVEFVPAENLHVISDNTEVVRKPLEASERFIDAQYIISKKVE